MLVIKIWINNKIKKLILIKCNLNNLSKVNKITINKVTNKITNKVINKVLFKMKNKKMIMKIV